MTRQLASTRELIPFGFLKDGYMKSSTGEKFRAFSLTPIPSSTLESDLSGPSTHALFERLEAGLGRLPSNFQAQVIIKRERIQHKRKSLFEAPEQFLTRFFLVEKELGRVFGQTLVQLFAELSLSPQAMSTEQSTALLQGFFAQEQDLDSDHTTLPDSLWETGHVKFGNHFMKAISLTEMPETTWPTLLQELIDKQEEYLISLKLQVPPKEKTQAKFARKRRVSHALSIKKAGELSDIASNNNASATEEVLGRLVQGKECIFECSLAIFQSDRNLERLNSRSHAFASSIASSTGAGFYSEQIGTLPVLRSHIPLAPTLSLRDHPILSGNLAHLLPIFCDYTRFQEPSPLLLSSRSGELSHLNLFSKQNINFNAFVCGASGSGKSFLVNSLLASACIEQPDTQITVFDVGGSYTKTIKHLGGESLQLDKNSATKLVNSHLRSTPIQNSSFLRGILESFCNAGSQFTHSHEVAIEDLLQSCAGCGYSFKTLVNEALERPETAFKDIAFWLRPFLEWDDLPCSRFDLEALEGKVRAFDFKALESEPTLLKLVLFTLTKSIWRRLADHKAPRSIVVFDEVWKFFASSSAYLEEMYRTFRKYHAGIISVTQSLADYGEDAFAKLIVQISHTKILMQAAATSSVLKQTLDISDDEIKRLLSLASHKGHFSEFWLGTPDFNQILRLYPNPELYSLANTENLLTEGGAE